MKINLTSVLVDDQAKALAFYTDVLGFEPKDDITLGDGYRWCTVVHPKQPELNVNLAVPGEHEHQRRRGDQRADDRDRGAMAATEDAEAQKKRVQRPGLRG